MRSASSTVSRTSALTRSAALLVPMVTYPIQAVQHGFRRHLAQAGRSRTHSVRFGALSAQRAARAGAVRAAGRTERAAGEYRLGTAVRPEHLGIGRPED